MTRRILLVSVLMCLILPTLAVAAAPPATGTNWLQSVTSQVDTLTTTHGDALVDMGVTELNFIALMALIAMVVRWNLAHMVIGYRPVNFTIGDLFVFFFKLFACSLMLHYYFNPCPGTAISLHNLFAAVAQAIASTLDQNIMNDFLTRIRKVGDSSQRPVGLDLIGVIVYFGVMVNMALIDLAMFAVDAFGWVAVRPIFTFRAARDSAVHDEEFPVEILGMAGRIDRFFLLPRCFRRLLLHLAQRIGGFLR